jgi:hypothetical protein
VLNNITLFGILGKKILNRIYNLIFFPDITISFNKSQHFGMRKNILKPGGRYENQSKGDLT